MSDLTFTASTLIGGGVGVHIDRPPDSCPRCHSNVLPIHRAATADDNGAPKHLEVVFQCTRQACGHLFISTYRAGALSRAGQHNFEFVSSAPLSPKPVEVSAELKAISPTFLDVYNQALAAEAHGLDQLTGIGLRKALEFLVKDFAISEFTDRKQKILSAKLGVCINTYIRDANTRECAKRAAWLGNDETHYLRRWVDRDINDLKILIRLTLNWIDNVLLTKRYTSLLPSP